nr:hypothetical protein [Aeromicrobium sp.]
MAAMPFVQDVKHVARSLDLVLKATTPGTVTPQHLAENGLPEPGATQAWTFLRDIGFLDADGTPTERWIAYRDADDPKDVLRVVLDDIYAPLVELVEDGSPSDADLEPVVESGDEPGAAAQVVATFRSLCERAGIGHAAPVVATRPRRDVLHDVSDLLQRSVNEFEQARQCLAHDLTRPAHVAAWNSFVALAFAHFADDDFAVLRGSRRRASWTLDELMRAIHGAELVRLLVKHELVPADDQPVLDDLLRQRNDCAHPMPVVPDRAETAAYLSAILSLSSELTAAATSATGAPGPDGTSADR